MARNANAKPGGMDRLISILQESNERLKDEGYDDRLSEGHLHLLVSNALGAEPLAFVANILALAVDARSRLTMQPEKVVQGVLALHDRIYGAPKAKVRKVDKGHDFQLDFAWGNPTEEVEPGDVIEVTRETPDGLAITTTHTVT
jgi:hypothetical protein